MKHLFLSILFLFATQAQASPSSVMGGKPMNSSVAHHTGVGWPSLFYEWWNAGDPDWALGAELVYGDWSGEFSNLEIGAAVNLPMRWPLMHRGRMAMAFRFAPGVLVGGVDTGPSDKFVFGGRGDLGLPMSIRAHKEVNVLTGITVPTSFIYIEDGDPFVAVPVLFRFGVEGSPIPEITPWILFEFGPAMAFGDFGSEVKFGFRANIGATFW